MHDFWRNSSTSGRQSASHKGVGAFGGGAFRQLRPGPLFSRPLYGNRGIGEHAPQLLSGASRYEADEVSATAKNEFRAASATNGRSRDDNRNRDCDQLRVLGIGSVLRVIPSAFWRDTICLTAPASRGSQARTKQWVAVGICEKCIVNRVNACLRFGTNSARS